MNRVLAVITFASFVASLFIRMTDPLVPVIAAEFAIEPRTAALVSTVFAIPWALTQPVLGPIGDLLGKTRVILACLFVLFLSTIVGVFATSFPLLLASRVVAGAAAGGVFPVSVALFGDLVPLEQRQVRMGSFLAWSITGTLLGAVCAGILGDLIPWRGIFAAYGLIALAAFVVVAGALRGVPASPPRPVRLSAMIANHRRVWSSPRAVVCFGAVFTEGVVIIGLFPFVAVLLVSIGESRASIAGLVLAAFLAGGVVYSLAVGKLVARFSAPALMLGGGLLTAAGLLVAATVPPWPVQVATFFVMGCGFYTLHASIMIYMTELAPDARGTAVAGHALSYYSGQAIGPIAYGTGFAVIGASPTIVTAAVVMVLIATLTPWFLKRRGPASPD